VNAFAERALLPEGWARNVALEIDETETIVAVRPGAVASPGATVVRGALLPGMPNIHSHAFQYAMAGRAEGRGSDTNGGDDATDGGDASVLDDATGGNEVDDFWTWRHAMYELAARLEPDSLYEIAREAYREMVRAGYASVVEFHYLHRDPAGSWYADRAAMAKALIEAARAENLAIALLPALYSQASPSGAPLSAHQRRFETSVDDILEISRELRSAYAGDRDVTVGICAHSLRAVAPSGLRALIDGSPPGVPIHLHIAEQEREVEEIEAAFGARPIAWLLDNLTVDSRWCLVHATQATPGELVAIARSGAVVGLCPTTEANLGDGIFPFAEFAAAGGTFGIGSDSNVTISPADELRFIEYGQRLRLRRRVVAASQGRSCGETLYADAAAGGGAVCGFPLGAIAVGKRAAFVAIDSEGAWGGNDGQSLDRHVFAQPRIPTRVTLR
jgi:formimidoylglutamate deiminase